ncbi:hypothetical protein PCL_07259 [Purpureocillium lilacinum]|uniref:Zn(2)-C6 fungal-type domain-containing protein n=1 Tax=Purpureocillium lilacinum TaxID=33203 RepID=A0A2U3DSI7_PURLI|nr:hypothetical protein PCL_07259 [Purpureocillium lilacinum]
MSSRRPDEAAIGYRRLAMASPRESQSMHPPSRPLPRRRSRIGTTVACEPCRRRRSRCNGQRPKCAPCVGRGLSCQYVTANASETQSEALKRKLTEMEQRLTDYERLYAALGRMEERDSLAVLNKLRLGVDVCSVLREVSEGVLLLRLSSIPEARRHHEFPYFVGMPAHLRTSDNPYCQSPIYDVAILNRGYTPELNFFLTQADDRNLQQDIYQQPYHSAIILDPRLSTVDLSGWTSVTSDVQLMRELLHAYFLHEYPMVPSVHKDSFLQAAVDHDNRLCSPLLVNALLAEASASESGTTTRQVTDKVAQHCFIGLSHREQFWNPNTPGYSFLAEARRLWELHADDACDLPTLQAALALHVTYTIHGMDKIGYPYLVRAVSIAKQMRLLEGNRHVRSTRLRCARDFTAWCLFNWQTFVSYLYYRSPLIKSPPASALPDPDHHASWHGEFVLKYSSSRLPSKLGLGHVFNAASTLRVIVNDLANWQFRDPNPQRQQLLSAEIIYRIRARLEAWYASLPPSLRPDAIALPWQLKLHMEYQMVAAALAQTRTAERLPSPLSPASSTGSTFAEGFRVNDSSALGRLETIVRLYYARHGFERCDSSLLFVLPTLVLASSENMAQVGKDVEIRNAFRSALVLGMKGLYDQGKHSHMAAAIYRLLRNQLSPGDMAVLREYGHWYSLDEEKPLIVEHVRSQWPLAIIGRDINPEALSLQTLACTYSGLHPENRHSRSRSCSSDGEYDIDDWSMATI